MSNVTTQSTWEELARVLPSERKAGQKNILARCRHCGREAYIDSYQLRKNMGAGCGKCYTLRRTYDTHERPCSICGCSVSVRSNYSDSYTVVCRSPACVRSKSAATSANRRSRSVEELLRCLLIQVRSRSKRKGIDFDLDEEWVCTTLAAQQGKCALTGVTLLASHPIGKRRGHKHTASIDKIDPDKGYTKDNCWLISYIANVAKNAHSVEDLMEFATDLLRNNGAVIVSEGTCL